jgi:hypothetical protein
MLRVMKHIDFIALQFYNRVQIELTSKGKYLGFFNAWGILDVQKNTRWVTDSMGSFPQGLLFLHLSYNIFGKPIIITGKNRNSEDKKGRNSSRKNYNQLQSNQMGVNVKIYTLVLMDNYEWTFVTNLNLVIKD